MLLCVCEWERAHLLTQCFWFDRLVDRVFGIGHLAGTFLHQEAFLKVHFEWQANQY